MMAELVVDEERDSRAATGMQDRVACGWPAGKGFLHQDRPRGHLRGLRNDLRALGRHHDVEQVRPYRIEHLPEIREPALDLETVAERLEATAVPVARRDQAAGCDVGIRLGMADGARSAAENGGSIHGIPPEQRSSNDTWFGLTPARSCASPAEHEETRSRRMTTGRRMSAPSRV